VSLPEFVFAVHLSGQPDDDMLGDLTATILRFVGSGAVTAEIVEELRARVVKGRAGGPADCDVRFNARDGKLVIAVSQGNRHIWGTSRHMG